MPIYVQFDGIAGESTNSRHPHSFECTSYSWGASLAVDNAGGGGGAGRPHFTPVTIMMPLELRTPELMLAVINGRHITNAHIYDTVQEGDGSVDVQTITFTHVVISSWLESSNGELPAVQFTFEYGGAQIETMFANSNGEEHTDTVNFTTNFRG